MEPALNNAALMNKHLEKVPPSFECQITLEVMEEPFMHIRCGSTSEAKEVRAWVAKGQTCQNCREHVTMADFGPNLHLKNAIQEFPEKVLKPFEDLSVAIKQKNKELLQEKITTSTFRKGQAEEAVSKAQSKSWGNTILAGTINSVCLGVILAGTGPVGVVGALGAATVNAVRGIRKHEDLLQEELIAKENKADRERSIERKRQEIESL